MAGSDCLAAIPAVAVATAILSAAKEWLASACAVVWHSAPATLKETVEEASQLLALSSLTPLNLLALRTLMGFAGAAGGTFAAAFERVEWVAEKSAASAAELSVAHIVQVVADKVSEGEHTPAVAAVA